MVVKILTREGAILRGGERRGREGAGPCPAVDILKGSNRLNRGRTGTVQTPIRVY